MYVTGIKMKIVVPKISPKFIVKGIDPLQCYCSCSFQDYLPFLEK